MLANDFAKNCFIFLTFGTFFANPFSIPVLPFPILRQLAPQGEMEQKNSKKMGRIGGEMGMGKLVNQKGKMGVERGPRANVFSKMFWADQNSPKIKFYGIAIDD
jgi:hypothetical protein